MDENGIMDNSEEDMMDNNNNNMTDSFRYWEEVWTFWIEVGGSFFTQCCGSGYKVSASFCRIRIHNIFHGSGSRSRSEPSSLPPPLPSSFTLNLSPLLPPSELKLVFYCMYLLDLDGRTQKFTVCSCLIMKRFVKKNFKTFHYEYKNILDTVGGIQTTQFRFFLAIFYIICL